MPEDLAKLLLGDATSCRAWAKLHHCAALILSEMADAQEAGNKEVWFRCVSDLQDLAERQEGGKGLPVVAEARA